jgi:hypothetical protein
MLFNLPECLLLSLRAKMHRSTAQVASENVPFATMCCRTGDDWFYRPKFPKSSRRRGYESNVLRQIGNEHVRETRQCPTIQRFT